MTKDHNTEQVLSTREILSLERRSNMTDDEAIRFARSVEGKVLQALGKAQEPVAWMDLHAELGKMRWLGADEGWDAAIEAVRKRLVELAAAPQPNAQQSSEKDAESIARHIESLGIEFFHGPREYAKACREAVANAVRAFAKEQW